MTFKPFGEVSRSTPGSCCRRSPTTAWRARRSCTARTTSRTASAATSSASPIRSERRGKPGRPGRGRPGAPAPAQRPHRFPWRRVHGTPGRPGSGRRPEPGRGRGPEHVPGDGAAADQPARLRARVLLPGHLSRRAEDRFARRLLRFPEQHTSISAATSSSICPSAPGSSPRRPTSCSGTAGPSFTLPKHRAYMGELGYLIGPIRLSPIRSSNASSPHAGARPARSERGSLRGRAGVLALRIQLEHQVLLRPRAPQPGPARLQRDQPAVAGIFLLGAG